MNGPQRTACLTKGYNNGKYKWIEVLVMGKKTIEIETHSFHLWKLDPGVISFNCLRDEADDAADDAVNSITSRKMQFQYY